MFDLKDFPKLLPIAEAPASTYCMIARDSDANTVATVAWNADATICVFAKSLYLILSDDGKFNLVWATPTPILTLLIRSMCADIVQWECVPISPTKRVNV